MKRPISLILVVLYKGILGILEIIGGVAMLVVLFSLKQIAATGWVQNFISGELAEDPTDRFINWILQQDPHAIYTVSIRVAFLLIILGAIKIALAVGVWRRSMLIRNIGLVFFICVALYGVYELATVFSVFKLGLFGADLLILYYFWKILPRHIRPVAVSSGELS